MKQSHENHDPVHGGYRALLGRLPYGYRWNREKGRLEVEPNEAGIYHWMVRMYVERGMSFRDIAIKLRGHGVKCKRAEWSKVTVSYVLKNPVYCGHYRVKPGECDGKPEALGADPHKRRYPVESYIDYPIPPLISNEYWKIIQEKIDFNRTKSKPGRNTADFFLRDVLKCGRCGASVKPRVGSVRKDGTAPRYYTCYWAGTSRKNIEAEISRTKCTLPFLKAEDLENAVWEEIIKTFSMNAEKGIAKLLDAQQYEAVMDDLQKEIDGSAAKLKGNVRVRIILPEIMKAADCAADELRENLASGRREISQLEKRIGNLKLKLDTLQGLRKKKQTIQAFLVHSKTLLRQLKRDIANFSLRDRKVFVEGMLHDHIVVDSHEDPEQHGPERPVVDFTIKWNQALWQRFIEEGKISELR